jgi:hypothetical protein
MTLLAVGKILDYHYTATTVYKESYSYVVGRESGGGILGFRV